MTLKIPERHQKPLAYFIQLSDESMRELISAVKEASPTLLLRDFASDLALKIEKGISADRMYDFIHMLASLYSVRVRRGVTVEEFVEEVCEAADDTGKEDLKITGAKRERFKEKLSILLSFDQSLGVTSKALDIMIQHEHVFCTARLLTDIRPVFELDVSKGPDAGIIIHTLKISYHEGDKLREFFVAMDGSDVIELQRLINRAVDKEKALRETLEQANLLCLEGKTH